MIDDVLVRTVTNLGQDWVWLADSRVVSICAGLPVDRLAQALEEISALLRLEDARRDVA